MFVQHKKFPQWMPFHIHFVGDVAVKGQIISESYILLFCKLHSALPAMFVQRKKFPQWMPFRIHFVGDVAVKG